MSQLQNPENGGTPAMVPVQSINGTHYTIVRLSDGTLIIRHTHIDIIIPNELLDKHLKEMYTAVTSSASE